MHLAMRRTCYLTLPLTGTKQSSGFYLDTGSLKASEIPPWLKPVVQYPFTLSRGRYPIVSGGLAPNFCAPSVMLEIGANEIQGVLYASGV